MKRLLVLVFAVALLGSCKKEESKTKSVYFEFECISNPDTVVGFIGSFISSTNGTQIGSGCDLGTVFLSSGQQNPDSLDPVYVGEYCTTKTKQLSSGNQCEIRGEFGSAQNISLFEWSSKFYVNDSLIQVDTFNTVGIDHYYTVP